MNKLWVALLFVVVLALLLTVGLTVTFVYRGKKDKKSDKHSGLLWSFLVDTDPVKTEGPSTKTLNFDVLKTKDYSVDGVSVTLRHVEHKFDELLLEGWVHSFLEPLKVVGVDVDKKQIRPTKAVLCSGFTVFNKETKPDFVTLWHDGDFYHYSTKGEHLSTGLFPFADKDVSKTPLYLDLPRGKEVGDVLKPEHVSPTRDGTEVPVTPPTEPTTPSPEEDEVKPTTPTPSSEPSVPDKLYLPDVPKVTLDLELVYRAKPGLVYNFVCDGVQSKLVRDKFGPYLLFTYTVGFMRRFHPTLRYRTTEFKLTEGKEGTLELKVYTHDDEVPLVVSYRDDDEFFVWKHKGRNQWERVYVSSVTTELIEDTFCFLNELVVLDFSQQLGSYTSGEFKVDVTKTTVPKLGEEFVCFKHEPNSTRPLAPPPEFRPYKYKFRKVNFSGLPLDKRLTHVTACFWKGNLGRPLLLRLHNRSEKYDYVGYKSYVPEKSEYDLPHRVARVNTDVNRVVNLNLLNTREYKYTGGSSSVFSFNDVTVEVEDYPGVKGIKKRTHRLSLTFDDNEPFYVNSFVDRKEVDLTPRLVSSVEAYFVDTLKNHPLMVVLKDHLNMHLRDEYFLLGENLLLRPAQLLNGDFDLTLRHAAHNAVNAVLLDFNKGSTYFYTGDSTFPVKMYPTVFVAREYGTPSAEYFKVRHRVEKPRGTARLFTILEHRGLNVPVNTVDKMKSVETYYSKACTDKPLLVVYNRENKSSCYLLTGNKYSLQSESLLSNLEPKLELSVLTEFSILTLRLEQDRDYYVDPDTPSSLVDVTPLSVPRKGVRRYQHKFPSVSRVRFKAFGRVYDPPVSYLVEKIYGAVVFTNEQKDPCFVSLLDDKGTSLTFKFDGERWVKGEVGDHANVEWYGRTVRYQKPVVT